MWFLYDSTAVLHYPVLPAGSKREPGRDKITDGDWKYCIFSENKQSNSTHLKEVLLDNHSKYKHNGNNKEK